METTSQTFLRDVIEASKTTPVLVDFWAPWCAPCRVLGPVLDKVEKAQGGRFKVVKVNTDKCQDLAYTYKINGIPAVKLFVDGKVAGEFVGALPESQVIKFLDAHLPTASSRGLADAKAALAANDAGRAETLLGELVAADPKHDEARIMLAELRFGRDMTAALDLVKDVGSTHPHFERANGLRILGRLAALRSEGGAADISGSRGWPAYERGIAALAVGNYDAAAEAWIEATKLDRKLDDDGPRRACVALFRWLGDDHPVTQRHRRAFATALF
jgi:putative thioredoxin